MGFFGPLVLWSWMPLVLLIFATRPVRDALVFSFVFAWLYLPNIGFDIPAFPNYTKMTATITGVVLGIAIFDSARVFAFRPKWYDWFAITICGCRFISAIVNVQGAWDGFSALLQQLFFWGFPYFIGRIYLSDLEGVKKLSVAMVAGAISYIPFCLIEMRMSPQFDKWVYAIHRWEGYRQGGFRPRVFMATGLELGMWMSVTTFLAWILTLSGAVKQLWGYSFRYLTIVLSVVNFFCKSTGAMTLLVVGLALSFLARLTKHSWPAWILILLPPAYVVVRTTGLWSGVEAVEFSKMTAGDERAQSLEFRFQCEDVLFTYTNQRPLFGYARNGGFNISARTGRQDVLIDGYWIIVFGESGLVGLVSFSALMILPMVLIIKRFPVRTWNDPDIAPLVGMAWVLLLYMVDSISNAMLNPVYGVASGALMGVHAADQGRLTRLAEASLTKARELLDGGHAEEAEHEYQSLLDLGVEQGHDPASQDIRARALEGLSGVYRATDHLEDAELSIREALHERLEMASEQPDPDRLVSLATAHETLARTLTDLGRSGEAIEQRRKALGVWASLAADHPDDPEVRQGRAASLNDLAWQLVAETNPIWRDPAEAAELALDAVHIDPDTVAPWNTLGVARYRNNDWVGAVEALERSVAIGPPGGTAFDHFVLAMAHHRLGHLEIARHWFARAIAWADQNRPGHAGLASFRSEASALLRQDQDYWENIS